MTQNPYLPAMVSELEQFALVARDSKLFGCDLPTAIVKLMAGASWGIPPMSALSDVYVVKGKPMASATLLRAMVRKSGRYDYRITENSDTAAEIVFYALRDGQREEIGKTRFTLEDAKRAGLTRNETYTKFARPMLLSRATSEGVKAHCPDVFTGSIYYAEEWGNELEDAKPIRVEQEHARAETRKFERDPEADPVPEAQDADFDASEAFGEVLS